MKIFGLYSKFQPINSKYVLTCVGFVKEAGTWCVLTDRGSTYTLEDVEYMLRGDPAYADCFTQ